MSDQPFQNNNYDEPFSEFWFEEVYGADEDLVHQVSIYDGYVKCSVEPDFRLAVLNQAPLLRAESLALFFAWLKVPESCQNLVLVCRALKHYLAEVDAIGVIEDQPLPDFLDEGLALFTEIMDNHIDDWLMQVCSSSSNRRNDPTHGIQTEAQFYAALPYPVNFEQASAQHRQLSAHLVFAAIRSWDDESKQYRHGMSGLLDDAAQAVRKLSSASCIHLLPVVPCSIGSYRAAINLSIEPQDPRESGIEADIALEDIKHLKTILNLLTAIDVDDDEITEEVAWKSLPPDFTDSDSFINYATQITTSKSELREIRKSGLAIDEISANVEYVIWEASEVGVQPDHPPQTPPSLDQQVLRRKHQITSMERGAQLLPMMWPRLRHHEIAQVLESIFGLASEISPKGTRQWKEDVTGLEAAVIALTSFWTARSIDESAGLILLSSRNHLPKTGRLTGIAYLLATDELVIPVVGPKQAPKHLGANNFLAEQVSPILLLPAPVTLAIFIRQLASKTNNLEHKETRFAASGPRDILIDRISACHANLKKVSAGRITPERVGELVFFQLYNETRDLAAAAITTGHRHRFADTALHYANNDIARLRDDYQKACRKIESIYHEETKLRRGGAAKDPRNALLPPNKQNSGDTSQIPGYLEFGRVGTPICPKLDTITRLQNAIHDASNRVHSQPCDSGFLVKHHNLLVLYTVLMIKAGTGYRDIRSPIPRRSDINLDDGTILVSDKDDASAFNTRVLPLVSPLREQWIEIDKHVRAFASRLAMTNPMIAAKIFRLHNLAPPPPKPKNERERKKQLKEKPVPPLFFLEESSNELSVVEIRPKSLAAEIELHAPWFELPTNANRSRLRTYLLDKNCPADIVDYLMGHWARGQEPLGRFATLPLSHYLEILKPHLEDVLQQEGWSKMRGIS